MAKFNAAETVPERVVPVQSQRFASRVRPITPLTGIYVKLRDALACGDPRPMPDGQPAARFAPVMHPDPAW